MGWPREDRQTNSVDGAAAFERGRAARYDLDDDIDLDAGRDLADEWDEELEERCGCSDPCCPCEGRKRGTP